MKNNETEILVSVICLTYNHEKYIKKCVDSLVNQVTNFKYEIIIHDDCSTDGTQDILREYEKKYPGLVKLILQSENQYSKGIHISDEIVFPITKGKYIAYCEGDDYWIDTHKLEKQINEMNKHKECWICTHKASIINAKGDKILGTIAPSNKTVIFNVDEVILGDGGFVATNSILINRKAFESGYTVRKVYSLDYFTQILGSIHGGMLYLNENMSAYRSFSEGSWSSRMLNDSKVAYLHYNKIIEALKTLNLETNYSYDDVIKYQILIQRYKIISATHDYRKLLLKENRDVLKALTRMEKLKLSIKVLFPFLGNFFEKRRVNRTK